MCLRAAHDGGHCGPCIHWCLGPPRAQVQTRCGPGSAAALPDVRQCNRGPLVACQHGETAPNALWARPAPGEALDTRTDQGGPGRAMPALPSMRVPCGLSPRRYAAYDMIGVSASCRDATAAGSALDSLAR
jgi:hypothetical protein